MTAAAEMIADLNCVYSWGRKWNINFEPAKCHSLCVSLKHNIDGHPPIFMTSLPIEEINHFKIEGFTFDYKLTWSNMIEHISTRCGQRMGALYRIKDYLGPRGLPIAFKALSGLFVRMEMLCLWVLLPLICPSLMEYSDCPRDQVRVHFQPCVLAAALVLLVYFVRCLHLVVKTSPAVLSSFFLLHRFHILTI